MPPSSDTADHELELVLRPGAPSDAAGSVVRSMALHVGLPAERATRVRTVVEELVREARERECVGDDAEIVVRTVQGPSSLRVAVSDRRLPLAPGRARSLPSRRLAALGFVDRLHVAAHGPDGNVAECEVHLDDREDEALDDTEVLAADVAPVDEATAAALVIRQMEPSDAPAVTRCVYRCYGYSYLDPIMYRPRLLRGALRSGAIHAVVAVDPEGEVVGHIALTFERPSDLVPEGGKLVVDPRYRGHHLAERLAGGRMELARSLGLSGVWCECVTNHPYSQREVLAGGGAETGMLIGATPSTVTMAALDSAAEGRHSLITMWTPVGGTPPAEVHVCAAHEPLVAQVTGRLGLDRTIRVATDGDALPASPAASHLTTSAAAAIGLAHLRVHRVGADLVARVADELDGLAAYDLAVVHLDLPVTDPGAGAAARALESLGFFWGAWLPGFAPAGDVLRLQRIADRPVDVDHVVCASPEGEAMRDAVVGEWHRIRRGVAAPVTG